MKAWLKALSTEQRLILGASSCAVLILVLIFIGMIWIARFPVVASLLPNADTLLSQKVLLPINYVGSEEWLSISEGISTEHPELAELSPITAKPLFWSSRRPLVVNAEIDEEPVSRPSSLDKTVLLGTYGAGKQGGVIVLHAGNRLRIAVGDKLEGWQLIAVAGDSAQFTDTKKKQHTLKLEHANVPVYTGEPAASAPSAPTFKQPDIN